MRCRLPLAAVTLLLVASPCLQAQMPDGSANRAALAKLSFMIGRWRGEASYMRGPGQQVQASMTETVQAELGGTVLLVEGLGTARGAGADTTQPVHNALAVISFDPQSATYTMRSYLANGQLGDFVLTLGDGSISWSRPAPGGQVRYTARIGNGEWHEIGEFSRDGTTWMGIAEMRLKKVP